jgi:photosystem II stability/assembly factor-like uncharacterized protein
MKPLLHVLRGGLHAPALALAAALATATAMAAASAAPDHPGAGRFVDPLYQNAVHTPLAERSLVTGLARAGERLVAVGQRGQILYSDDRGGRWLQARVPVSVDLTAVTFVNPREGWAVGHDGVVLGSTDGGANWQRSFDGTRAGAPARPLLDVWFENAQRGMAVGAFGMAVCTDNGGATWQDCSAAVDNPDGMHLNAIRQIDGEVFIAGEQGLLLRRDAGGRFVRLASPYKGSFFGLTGSSGMLLAYGLRGNAWVSRDHGQSWQRAETGVASTLVAGAVLADGAVAMVSQAGQLLVSRDGGASFKAQALARPQSAAAVLALDRGQLLVGGVRGLAVQALGQR